MIAVGADSLDPQLDSSYANFPITTLGDELPSLNCDFGDISSSDIDQLLLQSFNDFSLPLETHLPVGGVSSNGSTALVESQAACYLTSFLFEDIPRPRDLNLSFSENVSTLLTPTLELCGNATPSHSGGVTPLSGSRAASPTWSESSGSMSASSVSGTKHEEKGASRGSNPLPRHKRPSHKRAEIKRRDKIKTCLDDIKECVPSLRDKGKLSESAILTKAAEYIHQLKDGFTERGIKAAELRREIECLSTDIHNFQENLPAAGLKEESNSSLSLDDLYKTWAKEKSRQSTQFYIFNLITSRLFETFKEVVGSAVTMSDLTAKAQDWQTRCLALPVLRKQILNGMIGLSRHNSIVINANELRLEFGSSTDEMMEVGNS